jgi:hypothetical protein
MDYRIFFSANAIADIKELYDVIAIDYASPSQPSVTYKEFMIA